MDAVVTWEDQENLRRLYLFVSWLPVYDVKLLISHLHY
jgi:hypothetical protein